MSKWATVALVCTLVGLEADILGLLRYQTNTPTTSSSPLLNENRVRATPAVIIVAFILYVAMASLLALTKIGLPFNAPVSISTIVLSFSSAVLLVAGSGNREASVKLLKVPTDELLTDPYGAVLEISAAALALVVFIATILHLVHGRGTGEMSSKTSPSV